jgi:predicted DNA-binding antitoxin AbrB/MazE fold protein
MTLITAVYEKGLLRPLTPLNLTDRQTVRLQMLPEETRTEADEVRDILVAAGLMLPRAEQRERPPAPLSEEERRRLADQLGRLPGKPLSEIIIEDRGPW